MSDPVAIALIACFGGSFGALIPALVLWIHGRQNAAALLAAAKAAETAAEKAAEAAQHVVEVAKVLVKEPE